MPIDPQQDWLDFTANRLASLAQMPTPAPHKPEMNLPDHELLVMDNPPPMLRESLRRHLADAVCERAAFCRDAHELFADLKRELPAGFPKLIGVGSTRVIWELPLSLVAKVERDDPDVDRLWAPELDERGGEAYLKHLWKRRRLANHGELMIATTFPQLVVPVFGACLSFGAKRTNPGVLVVSKLTTLDNCVPDEDKLGILYSDLAIDEGTGHLQVCDTRFSQHERPTEGVTWASEIPRLAEEERVFHGNLGKDSDGRLFFADRGNAFYRNQVTPDYVDSHRPLCRTCSRELRNSEISP